MEDLLNDFNQYVKDSTTLVNSLKERLVNKPIPKSLKDAFETFDNSKSKYLKLIESNSLRSEEGLQRAKNVTVGGMLIGQAVSNFRQTDNQVRSLGERILNISRLTQNLIENTPIDFGEINSSAEDNFLDMEKDFSLNGKYLDNEFEKFERRVNKFLNGNELQLERISEQTGKLEAAIQKEIGKANKFYADSVVEIKNKKSQIDDILGHVSGRAIAGDFEESASDEKKMADWLRFGSIGCMVLIIVIVGYSFWESTTDSFNWQSAVFRIVLSFFLSLPAAYLARESSKHRSQQNYHLQTALDLKAITPYIASLPDDEQHKIKSQIAHKIFAGQCSGSNVDAYPINTQEILMEIIRKIDLRSSSKKDKE